MGGGGRGRGAAGPTPGFWGWAERLYADPRTRAWLLRWFWVVSLAFLAVGFTAIVLGYLRRYPWEAIPWSPGGPAP
jgi:hypothetical protein